MNWIEICKAGTWTAKNGKQVTLTTDDLDNIIRSYNPKERDVRWCSDIRRTASPLLDGWIN